MKILLIMSFLWAQILSAASEETTALQSCRAAGFDPYQLACSTCDLLPEAYYDKCKSCCLSYKTLEKRTKRYQAAVVAHATRIPGYFTEITDMVDQDWKELVSQKGKERLIFKDTSDMPDTPAILWFQELPENVNSMGVPELERLAQDKQILIGWKRDDVREMLKAIIPDK